MTLILNFFLLPNWWECVFEIRNISISRCYRSQHSNNFIPKGSISIVPSTHDTNPKVPNTIPPLPRAASAVNILCLQFSDFYLFLTLPTFACSQLLNFYYINVIISLILANLIDPCLLFFCKEIIESDKENKLSNTDCASPACSKRGKCRDIISPFPSVTDTRPQEILSKSSQPWVINRTLDSSWRCQYVDVKGRVTCHAGSWTQLWHFN